MKKEIIIVGAGPAGMTAAISAAREGADVTVLEGMERPGKKLLLTGNGRCNMTNTDPELPRRYYGSGSSLAEQITRQFGAVQCLEFFAGMGLLTREKNGYVYPWTGQSGSVLEVLLAELRRLKVRLKYSEKIRAISNQQGRWTARTDHWQYGADALILACGSRAVPSTGSDGSGYSLVRSVGHTILSPSPALVPVTCRGDFFQSLAGVRCQARIALVRRQNGKKHRIKEERGELQWTKYGVSGIAVFQLSRFIAACHEADFALEINLLPDFDTQYLKKMLMVRAGELGGEKAAVLFAGLLPDKLIPVILSRAAIPPKMCCGELSEKHIERILSGATALTLDVSGTKSFDVCQVCSGGVDCREVSDTLESLKAGNLFFAGEILDVDGPCGGYNLQWAWASGHLAGYAAAL